MNIINTARHFASNIQSAINANLRDYGLRMYSSKTTGQKTDFWIDSHLIKPSPSVIKEALFSSNRMESSYCLFYLTKNNVNPCLDALDTQTLLSHDSPLDNINRASFLALTHVFPSSSQINTLQHDESLLVREALAKRHNITFTPEQLSIGINDLRPSVSGAYKRIMKDYQDLADLISKAASKNQLKKLKP